MKFCLKLLFINLLLVGAFLVIPPKAEAAIITSTVNPSSVDENTPTVTLTFRNLDPSKTYDIKISGYSSDSIKGVSPNLSDFTYTTPPLCGRDPMWLKTTCGGGDFFNFGTYDYWIQEHDDVRTEIKFSFDVKRLGPNEPTISPTNPEPWKTITVTLSGNKRPADKPERNDYKVSIFNLDLGKREGDEKTVTIPPGGSVPAEFTGGVGEGKYEIRVNDTDGFLYWRIPLTVKLGGGSVGSPSGGGGTGPPGTNPCAGGTCPTAFGNISTNPTTFAGKILSIATGLAGGIALILMVIGSIRVLMSSGDQQRLAAGRDMIVAAVAGLLFLIFSVLILRFIGVNLLGSIPGIR